MTDLPIDYDRILDGRNTIMKFADGIKMFMKVSGTTTMRPTARGWIGPWTGLTESGLRHRR